METGLTLQNTINASGFKLNYPSNAILIPNCTINGGTQIPNPLEISLS